MPRFHPPPPLPENPVVIRFREKRAEHPQLRIADAITSFAGSMPFVYVHVVVFAGWMLFVEESPWPNRASAFQQEKADHDFLEQETELKTNTELTREIHKLTTELHRRVIGQE